MSKTKLSKNYIDREKILYTIQEQDDKSESVILAKSPKPLELYKNKDLLSRMMKKLYSISEQIAILAESSKKFDITPDTYRLFLRNWMSDEYRKFKINQIFLRKTKYILEFHKANNQNLQEQFELLELSNTIVDKKYILLEDYQYFINNYIKTLVKRRKTKSPKDEIENEIPIEFVGSAPKSLIGNRQQSEKENCVQYENKVSKAEDIDSVFGSLYKQEENHLNILPKIRLNDIPQKYEILTNCFEHPNKVKLFAEIDNITFQEDFVYIFDRTLLHAVNLDEFCKDNVLVVCGTVYEQKDEYRAGWLLYRYFKGKLYFIEHYIPSDFGASFERQTRMWMEEHYSSSLYSFIMDEWCDNELKK